MNKEEFIKYIQGLKGAPIVRIEAITDARLNKTAVVNHPSNEGGKVVMKTTKITNPYGKVKKRTITNTQLGCNYEGAVHRQGDREENPDAKDFKAGARQWGEKDGKVVRKGDKVYLRTQTTAGFRKSNKADVQYIAEDGRYLSYEQVAPFLPPIKPAKQAGNEGEVMERDYTLDNVKSVTIGGEKIILED